MKTKEDMKNLPEAKESKGKKGKSVHEGHRARLTDLAYNAGLENLSKFQVMEFFLTYIFPRGDVNPLAHGILDRFETFNFAIEADIEDLKRVKGINDRSAKMIHMFSELFYYFSQCRTEKKFVARNLADVIDVAEDWLRFRNTESMILLALSPANIITHRRLISLNKENEVGISILEFTSFLSSAKPTSLAIAHGHPYGDARPSAEDCVAFQRLDDLCNSFGVNLIDSFIVGENGVFGQREDKMLRTYSDVDEVKYEFKVYSND